MNPRMDENRETRSRQSGARMDHDRKLSRRDFFVIIAIAAVPLVPVLYILSIGPAFRMFYNGTMSVDNWLTFYGPVMDLAHDLGVSHWLVKYMAWWGE